MQSEWYRLDFLGLVRNGAGVQRWFNAEIDGKQHLWTRDRDVRRAHGIGLPRLGFQTPEVQRHDFGERLLERAIRVLDLQEPPEYLPRSA